MIRLSADLEMQMNAMERVEYYKSIETENYDGEFLSRTSYFKLFVLWNVKLNEGWVFLPAFVVLMSHVTGWRCFGWRIYFSVRVFCCFVFHFSYFVINIVLILIVYTCIWPVDVKFVCFLTWTIIKSNLI